MVNTGKEYSNTFAGKKVLVTGHTGFKGSWLVLWLRQLGAEVAGYALEPEDKSHFNAVNLEEQLCLNRYANINDYQELEDYFLEVEPDFVFHLAAQPLVRLSYRDPINTFETNIMGTVHVLDCLRKASKKTAAIFVTTDKCYSNKEWLYSYRENEPMGGHDPYSASKGAAELVVASYRDSYFSAPDSLVTLSACRAGNVIGGGDYAEDRIIPDCIRSLEKRNPIAVRSKIATRPWQHVLEPLSGYLHLARVLYEQGAVIKTSLSDYTSGFNFGPNLQSNKTVEQLVLEVLKNIPGSWEDHSDPKALHEASKLNLAIDKAFHLLDWYPVWDFPTTVEKTTDWYIQEEKQKSSLEFSNNQIQEYVTQASSLGLSWAKKSQPQT